MLESINPPDLGEPRGWTNGIVAPAGSRVVFVAGQTATDAAGQIAPAFAAQFDAAVGKVLKVIETAGGSADDIARMTVYVTDLDAYRAARRAIGAAWRARIGSRYPAMTLVEVSRLVDPGALVEIEATAVLPPSLP